MSINNETTAQSSGVTGQGSSKLKLLLIIASVIAFIFFYPRWLISALGAENPWTSYLYMYGLGFVVFLIGMVIIRSSGSLVLGRGRDSHWYKYLLGGFIFFAALHGIWIYLSLTIPFKG